MKRTVLTAMAALALLLGGCATVIRSDVTTFHQWPAQLADKTYLFETPPAQEDTLELRSYQNLVRVELNRLGFQDAGVGRTPALKVSMRFHTRDVPVHVVRIVDPFPSSRFAFAGPYGRRGYWGGYGSPFYDPFWGSAPFYEARIDHMYQREVQVAIRSAGDNRKLFDVTVHNSSSERSTPALMPALVQSAFEGFPGPSGVARRVDLKLKG